MIGHDILLFPDVGPNFSRTLKTLALYSEGVALHDPVDIRDVMTGSLRQKGAKTDLGIMAEKDLVSWRVGSANSFNLSQITENIFEDKEVVNALIRATKFGPQEFWDRFREDTYQCLKDKPPHHRRPMELFFTLLKNIEYAEEEGFAICSCSPDFRDAIWIIRDWISKKLVSRSAVIQKRRTTSVALAQVVLERNIPRADDLPIQEILKIRDKRKPEIEALRIGLSELATQIDLTQTYGSIENKIDELSLKADKGIRDLRVALSEARLDALKKIGKSWKSIAGATVPFIMSYAAGTPLPLSALMGIAGAVTAPILSAEIDRKKSMINSQWSILFRLGQY